MAGKILLSTAYLPPVQYISKIVAYAEVLIEGHENYQKQSYRNRCYIYGANGKQCLVIPVVKNHGEKTPIRSVEIDNKSNWQKIHRKSIESAYALSPFYEYYADRFLAAYDIKIPLLFDWNHHLLTIILDLLKIPASLSITENWVPFLEHDHRQIISPKKRLEAPDPHFVPEMYGQVFQERCGFLPNLSIIDLLFNEGPQAVNLIKQSIR